MNEKEIIDFMKSFFENINENYMELYKKRIDSNIEFYTRRFDKEDEFVLSVIMYDIDLKDFESFYVFFYYNYKGVIEKKFKSIKAIELFLDYDNKNHRYCMITNIDE